MVTQSERKRQQKRAAEFKARKKLEGAFGGVTGRESPQVSAAIERILTAEERKLEAPPVVPERPTREPLPIPFGKSVLQRLAEARSEEERQRISAEARRAGVGIRPTPPLDSKIKTVRGILPDVRAAPTPPPPPFIPEPVMTFQEALEPSPPEPSPDLVPSKVELAKEIFGVPPRLIGIGVGKGKVGFEKTQEFVSKQIKRIRVLNVDAIRRRIAEIDKKLADPNVSSIEKKFLRIERFNLKADIGARKEIEERPLETAAQFALGFGVAKGVEAGLKLGTRIPSVTKFLAGTPGKFIRKGVGFGATGLFVAGEGISIAAAPPGKRPEAFGAALVDLPLFFGGVKVAGKVKFPTGTRPGKLIAEEESLLFLRRPRIKEIRPLIRKTPFGESREFITVTRIGEPRITKAEEQALRQFIRAKPGLRKLPDVPITKTISEVLPKGLKPSEKSIVKKFLGEEKPQIFGGKALELRGIRKGEDIDVALKKSIEKLGLVVSELEKVSPGQIIKRREAIGIRTTKLFDIKPLARIKEFGFKEPPVTTKEKVPVIKTSEQFSRALAGTLELRKGGKDIRDVILASRALVKQGLTKGGLAKVRAKRLVKKLPKLDVPIEKQFPSIAKRIEGEVPKIPKPRVVTDKFGKTDKASKDIISQTKISKQAKDVLGVSEPKVIRRPRIRVERPSRIKPSRIKPSFIKPSRFKPSIIKPSIIPPSLIKPSKIKPSVFPSLFPPSVFGTSVLPPSVFGTSTLGTSFFRPSAIPSRITRPPPLRLRRLKGLVEKEKRKKIKKALPRIFKPSLAAVILKLKAATKAEERRLLTQPLDPLSIRRLTTSDPVSRRVLGLKPLKKRKGLF